MSTNPESATATRYRFGTAEFIVGRLELLVDGQSIKLEPRPIGVLHELLAHAGEVVTKDELHQVVWDGRPTVDNVIANAVAKLRKALGPDNVEFIRTIPRVGYQLIGVVERVNAEPSASSNLNLQVGEAVPGRDRYLLQRILGASYGHEVWLAHDRLGEESRVFKFSLSGETLSSLKRELTLSRYLQQSLSKEHMDSFVPVLDWNFEAPPFFVEMAYCGVNLDQWCATHKPLANQGLEQRLRLFLAVARAVGAAHSLGILHKDIKPANILVDDSVNPAQVRLLDFGSGKILDPTRLDDLGITQLGFTRTGDTAQAGGTPMYFSPEIIRGELPTIQSDVYALGVLLYQLVLGDLKQPIVSDWHEIIGDGLLREDISAATQGDRLQRLQSVAELVDRIQGRERRLAERASATAERQALAAAHNVLERNRVRRPWIAATLIVLIVGLGIATNLYKRSEAARDQAENINAFWNEELIRAGDPHQSGIMTVADVLDRAASRVSERFYDDARTRAFIHKTLGNAYMGLSRQPDGVKEFRAALNSFQQAGGERSEQALLARLQLSRAHFIASQFEEGKAEYDLAMSQIGDVAKRSMELQFAVAHSAGTRSAREDQWEAAVQHFEQALSIHKQLQVSSRREWYRVAILLVDAYRHTAQPEKALQLLEEMLAPSVQVDDVGLGRIATARLQRGQMLIDQGHYIEGEKTIRAAIPELRKAYGSDSFTAMVAEADMSSLSLKLERWGEAVEYAQKATDGFVKRLGSTHIISYKGNTMLGAAQLYAGQLQVAQMTLQHSVDGIAAIADSDAKSTHAPRYFLALTLALNGEFAQAAELLRGITPETMLADMPAEDWTTKLQLFRELLAHADTSQPLQTETLKKLKEGSEHLLLRRLTISMQADET
ncbi:MAG: protein kinase domain-containing protein [Oceanococcus sp.]